MNTELNTRILASYRAGGHAIVLAAKRGISEPPPQAVPEARAVTFQLLREPLVNRLEFFVARIVSHLSPVCSHAQKIRSRCRALTDMTVFHRVTIPCARSM